MCAWGVPTHTHTPIYIYIYDGPRRRQRHWDATDRRAEGLLVGEHDGDEQEGHEEVGGVAGRV